LLLLLSTSKKGFCYLKNPGFYAFAIEISKRDYQSFPNVAVIISSA